MSDRSTEKAQKYAVAAGQFSESIHVGRLNHDRTAFADKETHTDMVLCAVAQYVERHFGGGMEATFPGVGLRLTVKAEPLNPTGEEAL